MELAFSNLVKKASNFLGLGSPDSPSAPPLDGEIIYCKNNVCVHPPASLSPEVEHHPGYLNIRSQDDEILGTTLILTWIPNNHLKRNPRSIENSPAHPKVSPRRSPRQEYTSTEWSPTDSQGGSLTSTPSSEYAEKQVRKNSTDVTSISSSESSEAEKHTDNLGTSVKSQCDSGIGAEEPSTSSDGEKYKTFDQTPSSVQSTSNSVQNNVVTGGLHGSCHKVPNVGLHVNDFHSKDINVKKINRDYENPCQSNDCVPCNELDTNSAIEVSAAIDHTFTGTIVSPSSESEDMPTESQLQILVAAKDTKMSPINSQRDRINERMSSGSNRSITSIEMEGDKLVVVTEELQDSPFVEETEQEGNTVNNEFSSGDVSSGDSTYPSPGGGKYRSMLEELQEQTHRKLSGDRVELNMLEKSNKFNVDKLKDSLDLKLNLNNDQTLVSAHTRNPAEEETPEILIDDNISLHSDGGSSTTTSGPDSRPPTPVTPLNNFSPITPNSTSSDMQATHNMMFPDNSVNYTNSANFGAVESKSAKEQVCGVFSVDLGQMRFLRIFYSNDSCSSGHLVIASRESQYKILHFHHGGLDRLSDTFRDWKFLAKAKERHRHKQLPKHCRQFTVIRPYLPNKDKHPDEGAYEPVNQDTWHRHMSDTGQIEDHFYLKKATFFAGIEPSARQEVWPFLLSYYPYTSTFEEREQIRNDRYIEYQNIRKQRESMPEEEREVFWRSIQCIVEKDVVRTDRSHPYFKGIDNPNIEVLKNILLNYAVAQPHYGYTQGMSDLLAPVLAEVQNEADAYWCFVGLMQKTIFVSSPKDVDMDNQLNLLRELIRIMLPRFYAHMLKVQDGMELLFCHRWILLCFKREFPECDALRMWEACWAHFQTDYFHLFVCVAIISVYGEDVVEQDMPADETLLHFSSLSMHINGGVILKKARALLHRFRTRRKIPCTLEGLCSLCGSGMWDSGHVPTVRCVGNHPEGMDNHCPYGGVIDNSGDDTS